MSSEDANPNILDQNPDLLFLVFSLISSAIKRPYWATFCFSSSRTEGEVSSEAEEPAADISRFFFMTPEFLLGSGGGRLSKSKLLKSTVKVEFSVTGNRFS